MRPCPLCKEQVQDEALKCHFCKSMLVPIAESKPDTETGRVTYVLDRDLVRFGKFATAVLAVFAIVGAYSFGFKLDNALEKVQNVQDASTRLQLALTQAEKDLTTEREQVRTLKLQVETILTQARTHLATIAKHEQEAGAIILSIRTLSPEGKARLSSARTTNADKFRAGSKIKLWKNGATIRIAFLDGTPAQRDAVTKTAIEWAEHANLTFEFTGEDDADVRISFQEPGNWSYQGTDCLGVAADRPTMNLGDVGTLNGSSKGMVLHEFGHMLGLIHEFQNPNANIPWDRAAVYEAMLPTGKQEVDAFWFDVYSAEELGDYRDFDPTSIMMYPIPNAWTIGDFEVNAPTGLSESDKTLVGSLYPKSSGF